MSKGRSTLVAKAPRANQLTWARQNMDKINFIGITLNIPQITPPDSNMSLSLPFMSLHKVAPLHLSTKKDRII